MDFNTGLEIADGADKTITAICIVGGLVTGGISWEVLVAKEGGKALLKLGGKQLLKQGGKQILKHEGKQLEKNVAKQVAKQTGKSNIGAESVGKNQIGELLNGSKKIDNYNLKTQHDVQSQLGKYSYYNNTYGGIGKNSLW